MNLRHGLTRLLALACFSAAVLYGENDACLTHTALVAVTGKSGESAEGLTPADFKVTVGGKAATVLSATPADRPPRVVILVDASSNHDQYTWAATQGLVDEFLAGFPDAGDFTLLSFDDKVQRVIHESDRAALQGTMAEMFSSGKRESEAGLADAIRQASASFGAYRRGDAEFLITTSDHISKEAEQALKQQIAGGTRFSAISFDQSRLPDPFPYGGQADVGNYVPLEAAAKSSGGLWMRFKTTHQDPAASLRDARAGGKSIATVERKYLALELKLPSPITKTEKLKVELVRSGKGKAQELFATYPQDLFPCQ